MNKAVSEYKPIVPALKIDISWGFLEDGKHRPATTDEARRIEEWVLNLP